MTSIYRSIMPLLLTSWRMSQHVLPHLYRHVQVTSAGELYLLEFAPRPSLRDQIKRITILPPGEGREWLERKHSKQTENYLQRKPNQMSGRLREEPREKYHIYWIDCFEFRSIAHGQLGYIMNSQ